MPELPEVETNRKILEEKVGKKTIDKVVVYYRPIVSNDLAFEEKLQNQTIHSISRRAKYLIFNLDQYKLISHLRMEGKYMLNEARNPKHTHVEFYFTDGTLLSYHDTRKFGRFELIDKDEEESFFKRKKLAKDPDDLELNDIVKNIQKSQKTIKEILLDQQIIGGIGNIYANEILYRAKIHPSKRGFLLEDNEIDAILKITKDVMDQAVELGGSTIDTFETLGHKGSFQDHLMVHGKKGEPCIRCGTPIEKVMLKGRGTYYCPTCQKSKVIAITGGIATGKSMVSNYLLKKGFKVFDSDQAVKTLYQNPKFSKMVGKKFNTLNEDGTLNKALLRNLIFENKSKRKMLEKMIHPKVFEMIEIFKKENFDHLIFLDIPLLFETGYQEYDVSFMVTKTKKLQIERLMARDHVSEEDAIISIKSQISLTKKEKLSDYVIKNNGTLKSLYQQIDDCLMNF